MQNIDHIIHTLRTKYTYDPDGSQQPLRKITGRRFSHQLNGKWTMSVTHQGGNTQVAVGVAVWLWHHGTMPEVLWHLDGDDTNNNIENLSEQPDTATSYAAGDRIYLPQLGKWLHLTPEVLDGLTESEVPA